MRRVDQILPAFHKGDAIGDSARNIKKFLNSHGFSSQIYSLTIDDELLNEADFFSSFPPTSSSDIVIFHFALPSPLTDEIKKMPAKKIMIYHNITPAKFFVEYSKEMTRIAIEGRKQLNSLSQFIDLALADSEFNRKELEAIGYKKTAVFPLFIDFKKYQKKENPLVIKLFKDERINLLFVGRIVPNKKIEDNIKVLFYYKKYISPLIRMIVVGKTSSLPEYYQSLVRLADEFLLTNDDIVFTGHIPDEELIAYYKISDLFISLSEHEGFCLPLIESMIFNVPIIAYNCTAVPYTLGGAGVLVNSKKVDLLGELIHLLLVDKKLRNEILKNQRKRLEEFRKQDLSKVLLKYINNI